MLYIMLYMMLYMMILYNALDKYFMEQIQSNTVIKYSNSYLFYF